MIIFKIIFFIKLFFIVKKIIIKMQSNVIKKDLDI